MWHKVSKGDKDMSTSNLNEISKQILKRGGNTSIFPLLQMKMPCN